MWSSLMLKEAKEEAICYQSTIYQHFWVICVKDTGKEQKDSFDLDISVVKWKMFFIS